MRIFGGRFWEYLIFTVFLGSLGIYIHGTIMFSDVKNWPSVPAFEVQQSGSVIYQHHETRYGPRSSSLDTRGVSYRYIVDGHEYMGNLVRPDGGGGVPVRPGTPLGQENYLVHYKPSGPEIALLQPAPYRGYIWLLLSAVTGVIVALRGYFFIRDRYPQIP